MLHPQIGQEAHRADRRRVWNLVQATRGRPVLTLDEFMAFEADLLTQIAAAKPASPDGNGGTGVDCKWCCETFLDPWVCWYVCGWPFGYGCDCCQEPGA